MRWPGRVATGSVNDTHIVSGIDLLPTVLDLVGVPVPDGVDGRSFAPLLSGKPQAGRERVVTVFHETFAGERFEMRAIQSVEHGYIYNEWSDGERIFEAESQKSGTMRAMRKAALSDASLAARLRFHDLRSPEEFYQLGRDPNALRNLVDDPRHSAVRDSLKAELGSWMRDMRDPLAEQYARRMLG